MSRTTAKYSLQINGLSQAPGAVRWETLVELVEALKTTAERTARLVATGSGRRRGPIPAWLRALVDLEVTGLHNGSTVVELAAPTLGSAARDQFCSGLLWTEPPDLEDTALDLASRAISEILDPDAPGDLFDHAVLDAARDLAKALPDTGATWKLRAADPGRASLAIEGSTEQAINRRMTQIPAPQTRVVTGTLDEIGHRKGQFQLRVAPNSVLRGEVLRDQLHLEALRDLWGREATVTGVVHFKLNGTPRRIEARSITTPHEGDVVFRILPAQSESRRLLFPPVAYGAGTSGRSVPRFEEEWPGEETLEELLADLD